MRICVIIPALNEEECIGRLVASLPRPLVSEVIVVDNNSSDRTAEVARAAGATVLTQARRGYGHACAAGADAAGDAELLVFMDGDLSDDPAELPNIVAPIISGEADLVLGTRTHIEPGSLTPHQIAGNRVALILIALLLRRRLQDLPSFKAVRRAHALPQARRRPVEGRRHAAWHTGRGLLYTKGSAALCAVTSDRKPHHI